MLHPVADINILNMEGLGGGGIEPRDYSDTILDRSDLGGGCWGIKNEIRKCGGALHPAALFRSAPRRVI